MPTRFFTRDDQETEVEVDFTVNGGSAPSGLFGLPEDYDPGEPPEVVIEDVWLVADRDKPRAQGATVTLTDAESERFEQEVLEDPDTYEPNEPDYD